MEVSQPFRSFSHLLNNEKLLWLDRTHGKTLHCIEKCKSAVDIAASFVSQDNASAALSTFQKHKKFYDDLKRAFRRRKKEKIRALELYIQCLKLLIKRIEEE